jgi:hypothetical protein
MWHFDRTRIILAFIFVTFISCATGVIKSDTASNFSIIGKWEGVDRTGRLGAFEFAENGNMTLIIDGKPLGSSDPSDSGTLKYTIDYSKEQIELDIIGIDETGSQRGTILMIIRIISKNSIKIRTYFNETRPANFDDETPDDTIILNRTSISTESRKRDLQKNE